MNSITLSWQIGDQRSAREFSASTCPEGILVGRNPESTIHIPCSWISKRHCRIIPSQDGWSIEDVGSSNGTFVDGKRIGRQAVPLSPSSIIVLGLKEQCEIHVRGNTLEGVTGKDPAEATAHTKNCPACGEVIKLEAKKCKHCGEYLDAATARDELFTGLSEGIALAEEPKTRRELRACPECGTVTGEETAVCVECGHDFRTGRRVVPSARTGNIASEQRAPSKEARGKPATLAALRKQRLTEEEQLVFGREVRRRRKSVLVGYLLWVLLGWHYAYVHKWGLQFLYWFTAGGFLIWMFLDLFRMPGIIRRYNESVQDAVSLQVAALR